MVVLNVIYKCKPGMREAFLEAIKAEGLDVACRNEEGNIKYDYYRISKFPLYMLPKYCNTTIVSYIRI